MSAPRVLALAGVLALLAGCADDRAAVAFPFTGTWVEVRGASLGGDHVTDPARIGAITLSPDEVVIALAHQPALAAVPRAARGTGTTGSGSVSLPDGTRLLLVRGEGMVEQQVGDSRIGIAAPYLDVELVRPGRAVVHARLWSEASLRTPVLLSERAAAHAESTMAATAVPAAPAQRADDATTLGNADSAFLAIARACSSDLGLVAAVMVRAAGSEGSHGKTVTAAAAEGCDAQRHAILQLLLQARGDQSQAPTLLGEVARRQRALVIFQEAALIWQAQRS